MDAIEAPLDVVFLGVGFEGGEVLSQAREAGLGEIVAMGEEIRRHALYPSRDAEGGVGDEAHALHGFVDDVGGAAKDAPSEFVLWESADFGESVEADDEAVVGGGEVGGGGFWHGIAVLSEAVGREDFVDDEGHGALGAELDESGHFVARDEVSGGGVGADEEEGARAGGACAFEGPEIDGPDTGAVLEWDFEEADAFEGGEAVEEGIGRRACHDVVAWGAEEFEQCADGFARRGEELDARGIDETVVHFGDGASGDVESL